MTPNDSPLATARRLMEAWEKTRGPWYQRNAHVSRHPDGKGVGGTMHTHHVAAAVSAEDAAFIAAAHTQLPALCRALDEAEAEVARLKARVAELETAPNTDPDCFDHADNVCVDWCGGCQRGVYGRAKRASAMTPGETP